MPAAVDSSLDVVYWFLNRAMAEREHLQPQKLHRLLFLAQAYYAVAYYGRKLMPTVFVADELGPVEPTVFRLLETGLPQIEPRAIPDHVDHFLDSVWRRFGPHSVDHLSRLVKGHAPYVEAWRRGRRAEISLEAMRRFYSPQSPTDGAPPVSQVLRPRLMRSQTGKPVAVRKWMPPVKPTAKPK